MQYFDGFRLFLLWAMVAGAAVVAQAGVNGELASRLGHPLKCALVSFLVGCTALVVCCAALRFEWPSVEEARTIPVWLLTGGLLGVFFLASTMYLGPRIGATTTFSAIVAGQMIASLLFDHFGLLGFSVHTLNPLRLLGAGLVVGGVLLITRSS